MGELSEPLLKDVEESDEEKEEEKEEEEEDVGASLSRGRKIAMAVSVAGGEETYTVHQFPNLLKHIFL